MCSIDLEQLATFMGLTVGTVGKSYLLPDNVYQTATIAIFCYGDRRGSNIQRIMTLEEIQLPRSEK